MYIHIFYVHASISLYIYICTYSYFIYACMCMYVLVNIYILTQIHKHTYIHKYIHTYMHAYIHTYLITYFVWYMNVVFLPGFPASAQVLDRLNPAVETHHIVARVAGKPTAPPVIPVRSAYGTGWCPPNVM
jgi:hypothetical protein